MSLWKKLLSISLLVGGSLALGVSTKNILALEWHNSYCNLHPRSRECVIQFFDDWSSNHFTLHGLWPQKGNYCSRQPLRLSHQLVEILKKYMPGVVEGLHYHEWQKHGTCFGTDPETYFKTAINLTYQFNYQPVQKGRKIEWRATPIQRYFATHQGQYVTFNQVRWLFKKSFGKRNGRKFQLVCKRGKLGTNYITEIRVFLKGDPTRESLQQLIDHASPVVGRRQCQRGLIAPPPAQ